ncbi:ABC transporter permease [Bacillus horti]|uniref:Transport permease protein n=1 Tax=Caldalkalibacillus horti TaxID=77523 RepID=A0ABT9VVK0_9BACI|nr:ABC transporter permease [Bacillus horti]MDQ0165003.1 ABC-2 type transport system permease protein [Bacillus horti]
MNNPTNPTQVALYSPRTTPKNPSAIRTIGIFMWRSFQGTKNNFIGYMMDAMLGPVIMMLIFTFLFGGAIAGSTTEYIQYLLPGIFVLTVVPMTVYSGTSICVDISKGVYNRFRTMPFWQPSSVFGPIITDGLRYVTALFVAFGMGMLLGFRPENGAMGSILAILFTILFAFSVSWIFALIGVIAKRPETVSGSSMIFVYPLLFGSSILVDSSTMPKWMQVIVDLNPISIAATTVRELFMGNADSTVVLKGLCICLLIFLVFAPLTLYLYLNKNNK